MTVSERKYPAWVLEKLETACNSTGCAMMGHEMGGCDAADAILEAYDRGLEQAAKATAKALHAEGANSACMVVGPVTRAIRKLKARQ